MSQAERKRKTRFHLKLWLRQRGFGLVEVMVAVGVTSIVAMAIAQLMQNLSQQLISSRTYSSRDILVSQLAHVVGDGYSMWQSANYTGNIASFPANTNFKNCGIGNSTSACTATTLATAQDMVVTDSSGKAILAGTKAIPQYYNSDFGPCSTGPSPTCGVQAYAYFTATCSSGASCNNAASVTVYVTVQQAPGIALAGNVSLKAQTISVNLNLPLSSTAPSAGPSGGGGGGTISGTPNTLAMFDSTSVSVTNSNITNVAHGAGVTYAGIGTAAPATNVDLGGGYVLMGQDPTFGAWNNYFASFNTGPVVSLWTNTTPPASAGICARTGRSYGPASEMMLTINPIGATVQISNGAITTNPSNTTIASTTIALNGSVTANGMAVSSDRRLKKNIQPLTNALENIRQMRGVTFEWIDPNRGQDENIGLIAQEVEQVYPQLVKYDPKGYKSVNYMSLVSPLIEAVKTVDQNCTDTQAKNAQLKERVDKLEALVQSLSKQLGAMQTK
jgi:prepilin-type N-terminal cleavage/methylation domain-containing protein